MILNSVSRIKATAEAGVYYVYCNVTDDWSTYDTETTVRPDDPYGQLNQLILDWMEQNPEFPIEPYVPPTPEEIRANMPSLSRRQLRLGLIDLGITPSEAQTIIDGKPAGIEKEKANVEWNDRDYFNRLHSLVLEVTDAYNITPEALDVMWMANTNT